MKPKAVLKQLRTSCGRFNFKKVHLKKEYMKLVKFSYSIMHVAFENSSKQV